MMEQKIPDNNYFDSLEQAVYSRIGRYQERQRRNKKIRQTAIISIIVLFFGTASYWYSYRSESVVIDDNSMTVSSLLEEMDVDDADMYAFLQDTKQQTETVEDEELLYYLANDETIEYDLTTQK